MDRTRRLMVFSAASILAAAAVGALVAAAPSFGKRESSRAVRSNSAVPERLSKQASPTVVLTVESVPPQKLADPCRQHLSPTSALKGPGGLERENRMADCYGLTRIADTGQLEGMIRAGELVPIQPTAAYQLDHVGELDQGNRWMFHHARPWVKAFLDDTFGPRHRETGEMFFVTSLVRTEHYQRSIRGIRHFRSAAADGISLDRRSSHLTGSTVDIRISGMSRGTLRWLRGRLLELETEGRVQATEERLCFHVMVYPNYSAR